MADVCMPDVIKFAIDNYTTTEIRKLQSWDFCLDLEAS
jgi:hypothetical protein